MKSLKQCLIALVLLLCSALGSNAFADILYSNGPDQLAGGNWLSAPGASSQGFSIASTSTLTSMTISVWAGTAPTTVNWVISTALTGVGAIQSGTSAISNQYDTSHNGYTIFNSTFSLPSVALDAGTYFATLQTDGYAFWGINHSPNGSELGSATLNSGWAYWVDTGTGYGYDYVLTVNGNAGSVPEPASLALVGLGLAGIGFARRKKQKAA